MKDRSELSAVLCSCNGVFGCELRISLFSFFASEEVPFSYTTYPCSFPTLFCDRIQEGGGGGELKEDRISYVHFKMSKFFILPLLSELLGMSL